MAQKANFENRYVAEAEDQTKETAPTSRLRLEFLLQQVPQLNYKVRRSEAQMVQQLKVKK